MNQVSEDLQFDVVHDGVLDTREKQMLLGCLLQDPKHSWLHYLDERQALRVCLLLHQTAREKASA